MKKARLRSLLTTLLVLALTAPLAARTGAGTRIRFGTLAFTLPGTWSQTVGLGGRVLVARPAARQDFVIWVYKDIPLGGKNLAAHLADVRNPYERGRTVVAEASMDAVRVLRPEGCATTAIQRRVTRAGGGGKTIQSYFAFDRGSRVQVLVLNALTSEAEARYAASVGAALREVKPVGSSSPPLATRTPPRPEPVRPEPASRPRPVTPSASTAIRFGRLAFSLPGPWRTQKAGGGKMLQAAPEGRRDFSILVFQDQPKIGGSLASHLSAVRASYERNRTVVPKGTMAQPGRVQTDAGVQVAMQQRVTRAAAGGGAAVQSYFAFDMGARAQVVVLVAGSESAIRSMIPRASAALKAARVEAAGPAPGPGPAPPPSAGAVPPYARPGFRAAAYAPVAIDKKAAFDRLQVKLYWCRRNTGGCWCRDAKGNLLISRKKKYFYLNSPSNQNYSPTWLNGDTVTRPLRPWIKPYARSWWGSIYPSGHKPSGEPPYGTWMYGFKEVEADARGNVYTQFDMSGHATFVCCIPGGTQSVEMVASTPATNRFLKQPPHFTSNVIGYAFKPSPEGDVWFFITQSIQRKLVRICHFRRAGPGQWMVREVPFYKGMPASGPQPDMHDARDGCPDWWGGWLFRSKGFVWRIDVSGRVTPVIGLSLHLLSTSFSNLAVTREGDLWIAFNGSYGDTIVYTTPVDTYHVNVHTKTFFWGCQSGLLRIRLLPGGRRDVRAISDEKFMDTVRAAGIQVKGKLLRLSKLRVDHGVGGRGITAWHGSPDLFYGIAPAE